MELDNSNRIRMLGNKPSICQMRATESPGSALGSRVYSHAKNMASWHYDISAP
jgi:hypothetical protein